MVDSRIVQISNISCPNCGHAEEEQMRLDACQVFYTCKACGSNLRPLKGDCCVFCSFGSDKCPFEQAVDLNIEANGLIGIS